MRTSFTLVSLLSIFLAFVIIYECPADETASSGYEKSWTIQMGQIFGDLKARNGDDLNMTIVMMRFGFPLNHHLGLAKHKGKVTFFVEPFLGPTWTPDNDVVLGAPLFLEYSYPLSEKFSLHTGFGAGPSYFGVDTVEEGSGGFEFFDSASAGFRYRMNQDHYLTVEYRGIHISDLHMNSPNNGVDAYGFFFGLSSQF